LVRSQEILSKKKESVTKEEVTREIMRVYLNHFKDNEMTIPNFRSYSKMPFYIITTHFGTWKKALNQCGITENNIKHTKKLIIEELRRVYFEHFQNNHMTKKEFGQYSNISVNKIIRYFDKWDNALAEAKVIDANDLKTIRTNEVISEIKRVYYKYFENSRMSIGMFRQHSTISIDSVYKYFKDWDTALKGANVFFIPEMLTTDDKRKYILSELHKIKDINNGLYFNFKAYQDYKGRYKRVEILKLFGCLKWSQLINEELGIYIKIKPRSSIIDYSEKELFDEMKRVWEKLGTRPTNNHFVRHTTISAGFYLKKYKTWTLFVEHFLSKNEVYNSYICQHRHSFEVSKDKLIKDLKRVKKNTENKF
jgi:Homing endonuclease associated repeat